jgi:hypothetical protein
MKKTAIAAWFKAHTRLAASIGAVLVAAIYTLLAVFRAGYHPLTAATDGLFMAGLIWLVIAMLCIIRNGGMFKLIGYGIYRLAQVFRRGQGTLPLDMAAYFEQLMARPKLPTAVFLVIGGVMFGVSCAMAVLFW